MKKILKILKIFIEGGCVGVTLVNIGHIIGNNIDGILLEETNKMALINFIQFLLFGGIFAIAGNRIRRFRLIASVDKRMKMLRAHRIMLAIFIIISIVSLTITWYYDMKIAVIAIGMLIVTFIITEVLVIIRLKSLRHKIFLK